MKWLQVEHSPNLSGTVKAPGSKNSSLALLAAACLADEPVTLSGIPDLADFAVIGQIAEETGIRMIRQPSGDMLIDAGGLHSTVIDPVKSSQFRTSYYFIGALLAKHGKITVGFPGGDDFVSRPIDQHIKAFQAMGATFSFHRDYYEVEARELRGADIYFDTITCGATLNSMMAAVLAKGRTTLRNAARDPELVDTANMLNLMGAKIRGAGTDTIHIDGVARLSGCAYTVIPDRLIAGSLLMAAGVTGGTVTITDVIPEHLSSCIAKLREIGLSVETGPSSVTAASSGTLRATRIRTAMYPGFATDLQQPATALLTQAAGKSIVTDKVYPHRFNHVEQLVRMGADIEVRSGTAFIRGGTRLRGAMVHAADIRAGTCLVLAGFAAEGRTIVTGTHHLERGYENVVGMFRSLGASIRFAEPDDGAAVDYAQIR